MASIISAGTTSGTSLNLSGDTSGVLQLATNGSTTAVTITTAQNVGIGTASPATKAEIYGTAAASNLALRITNTATDGYSTLQLGDANAGVYRNGSAQSGYAGASSLNLITVGAHNIGFSTQNTLRATITSSGDVGIGTSSPNQKLQVNGNIMTANGSAANPGYNFVASSATGMFTPDGFVLGFSAAGTERMRLNSSGTLILQGGNTSATGVGITFPATQSASSDANTLDDYEEGTWTPTIVSQTGSITSYTSTGQYTKIGRNVFLTFTTTLTNVGTAGGRLQFSNLPFTALNLSGGRPAVFVGRENAATGIPVVGWLDGNQTTGEIASLSFTAITWTNNYQYTMSVTYQSTQ